MKIMIFLRMAEGIKCEPMVDVKYAGFSARNCWKRDYKLSVSLSSLDSIYRTGLAAEGLTEVITSVDRSGWGIFLKPRSISR